MNASPSLNMRSGPGTAYSVMAQLPNGTALKVLAKLADGTWYKVKAPDGKEGWVNASFLTFFIDKAKVPTATPPPSPTPGPPTPTRTPGPTPSGSPTLPPAPPPSGGAGFGYGVQASMAYADLGEVMGWTRGMGFNWIKMQVGWKYYESSKGNIDFGRLDQIVNAAQASGIRVLFSVVKAPGWARGADKSEEGPPANYNDYGDFVGALATRYRGRGMAYEIWNEQNLKREWTGEPLSAAKYVELLRVAYVRIKQADPNAIVVSGALTPTGWNDGVTAIDDVAYMQQMYQAGLIRYCDAVGAHPPGYNVPPSAEPGYQDPTATFRGPFDNPHPSWFFKTRMLQYRSLMVQYGDGGKRMWLTEFGWASIENVMAAPIPGWDQARDNSEAEQAAWLVEAFNLCRSWGFVGPMFVWNLNFGVTNPTEEYANFGIIRPDRSFRPAYTALKNMAK